MHRVKEIRNHESNIESKSNNHESNIESKSNIANHLKNICTTLDKLNATCDNLILLEYFNVKPEKETIAEFLNLCDLKNLFKQNICLKNPGKPTCIDFILTNCPRSFPKYGYL